jgi:hypothetical protein
MFTQYSHSWVDAHAAEARFIPQFNSRPSTSSMLLTGAAGRVTQRAKLQAQQRNSSPVQPTLLPLPNPCTNFFLAGVAEAIQQAPIPRCRAF